MTPTRDERLRVVVDDLSGPQVAAFLEEHVREMRSITPAGEQARRGGVASFLLGHIITEARRMGFTRLSLENGSAEFFLPARKLYERFGFDYWEPFAANLVGTWLQPSQPA